MQAFFGKNFRQFNWTGVAVFWGGFRGKFWLEFFQDFAWVLSFWCLGTFKKSADIFEFLKIFDDKKAVFRITFKFSVFGILLEFFRIFLEFWVFSKCPKKSDLCIRQPKKNEPKIERRSLHSTAKCGNFIPYFNDIKYVCTCVCNRFEFSENRQKACSLPNT